MKLFKGIFGGILVGLIAACVINIIMLLMPGLSCTCELVACIFDMKNTSEHLDRACDNACDGSNDSFDYTSVFIYSTLVCTAVGGIWGTAGFVKDQNTKSNIRKAQEERERTARYTRNQKEVSQELHNFSDYAQKIVESLYDDFDDIEYGYSCIKTDTDEELRDCKKKKNEAELIMKRLTSGKD